MSLIKDYYPNPYCPKINTPHYQTTTPRGTVPTIEKNSLCHVDEEIMSYNDGSKTVSINSIFLGGVKMFVLTTKNNTLEDWVGEPLIYPQKKDAVRKFKSLLDIPDYD